MKRKCVITSKLLKIQVLAPLIKDHLVMTVGVELRTIEYEWSIAHQFT